MSAIDLVSSTTSTARRAIPGIGYKMDRELRDVGVATVADVVATPRPTLLQRFGERSGQFLYLACRAKVTNACSLLPLLQR